MLYSAAPVSEDTQQPPCLKTHLGPAAPELRCREESNLLIIYLKVKSLIYDILQIGNCSSVFTWLYIHKFFKSMIGIIPCIFDADTVINNSKPQMSIANLVVVFSIKMYHRISVALLTWESSALCPAPQLTTVLARLNQLFTALGQKSHQRMDMERVSKPDFLKHNSEGQMSS